MKILTRTIHLAVSDEDFAKMGIDCMDEAIDFDCRDAGDLGVMEVMYSPVTVTEVALHDPINENTEEAYRQADLWESYARGFIRGTFGDSVTDLNRRLGRFE